VFQSNSITNLKYYLQAQDTYKVHMSYLGLCYINSSTTSIWGLQEEYICESMSLMETCNALYKHYVNIMMTPLPEGTTYSYFIEKYESSYYHVAPSEPLPMPIRTFRFNSHFECIDINEGEVVWQP
jgi:hypothetical protein